MRYTISIWEGIKMVGIGFFYEPVDVHILWVLLIAMIVIIGISIGYKKWQDNKQQKKN